MEQIGFYATPLLPRAATTFKSANQAAAPPDGVIVEEVKY
jgi:hypothetical protein